MTSAARGTAATPLEVSISVRDRKSTRLNSSHDQISYAVFCLKKKNATGFLEGSNVDLAQQFTNMIMAERGFQANSLVITTSDQILQDPVNRKHYVALALH